MISQKGFNAKIYKAEQKEIKTGAIYWRCAITLPRRSNGYWGYKKKDTGEWVPYLEHWDAYIYTDFTLEVDDEIKVTEFTIKKWLKKNNEFDAGTWKIILSIYGFTNETMGYAVQAEQKRRKGKNIKIIGNSTRREID